MNSLKEIRQGLSALSVYRGLLEIPAVRSLADLTGSEDSRQASERWGRFTHYLYESGQTCLAGLIGQAILYDDNVFTRASSSGKKLPDCILHAVAMDLKALEDAAGLTPDRLAAELGLNGSRLPGWESGKPPAPLTADWPAQVGLLAEFHRLNGFGNFARYSAFAFKNGALSPVPHINSIRLSDLKNYEEQRALVVDNTQAFLMGLPANNVLLYGDRGTGKSSTVHALLNQYAGEGLRIVEITKDEINQFSQLARILAEINRRFIIFIDDLSFSDGDDSFAGLKAVLEGGLAARPENALIYATSNRRHLVREKFSDRQGDEIHRGDTMQELLSLSDRFGLTVTFINPNRREYAEILTKIAADRGIDMDRETLIKKAEQFALERGGRSPRIARQFIDMAEARLRRGQEL